MKQIILFSLMVSGVCFSSCKKCYTCTKSVDPNTSTINPATVYSFDICNTKKENDGLLLDIALKDYQSNGYVCTAK